LKETEVKNLKPLHVLATCLILSGLLPGCAAERKCEAGGCTDDAKITANVQARINQHSDVGPPDSVQVRTQDHVVYLSGEVSQGLMKQTAEDVARQTPGVTKVINEIAITK
jgi:osmotically-inducible protein OsmY